jgi:hypothetical protein
MAAPASARDQKIDEILRGAELLIEYSSRNAMKPEGIDEKELQQLILRIAQARAIFHAKGFTEVEEAQFFCDFRMLSRAFAPVTVGSIRDSLDDETGRCRYYIWWGPVISPAAAAVRRFSICSFVALLALLAVQIIWLTGFDLLDRVRLLDKDEQAAVDSIKTFAAEQANIKKARDDADKKVQQTADAVELATAAEKEAKEKLDALSANSNASSDAKTKATANWEAAKNAASEKEAAYENAEKEKKELAQKDKPAAPVTSIQAQNRDIQRRTVVELLTWWKNPFQNTSTDQKTSGAKTITTATADELIVKNNRVVVVVSIAVNILQTYFLPLLYGFLGTCAYVLRQLTIETRARTFRRETEIGYWLRIFLGILAGLAVGWFLRPDPNQDGLIRGLTPFALSFVAGYSVEVLFAAMDRLVTAFGTPPPTGKA